MNRKTFVAAVLVLTITIFPFACLRIASAETVTSGPPKIEWNSTFPGSGLQDSASSIIQTGDGGYAVVGKLGNGGFATDNAMLVRITPWGTMLWNRTYAFLNTACGVVQTEDGGFVIVGNSNIGRGFILLKTDGYGVPLWNATCKISVKDQEGGEALTMSQTRDGGYIIAGTFKYYNVGDGYDEAFAAKFDSDGKLQWNETYGDVGVNLIRSAISVDGGYVLAGSTTSFGRGYDFWLIKTDLSGNILWNQTYGTGPGSSSPRQLWGDGRGDEQANSVVQTADQGYVLAGFNFPDIGQSTDAWLVKTDSAGNMQWNKTYGGAADDSANALILTSDGGLAFAGVSWSYPIGGHTRFWLVKTDSFGIEEWSQVFGRSEPFDPDTDIVNALIETTDGGFALAGSNNPGSSVHGGYFYVVKTTAVLPAPTPTPVPSPTSTPNPTPTSSASTTPSPSVPELPTWTALIGILLVVSIVVAVAVAAKRNKLRQQSVS